MMIILREEPQKHVVSIERKQLDQALPKTEKDEKLEKAPKKDESSGSDSDGLAQSKKKQQAFPQKKVAAVVADSDSDEPAQKKNKKNAVP